MSSRLVCLGLGWSTRRVAPTCDITRKAADEGLVYELLPVDIVWPGGVVFALYASPAWVYLNRGCFDFFV